MNATGLSMRNCYDSFPDTPRRVDARVIYVHNHLTVSDLKPDRLGQTEQSGDAATSRPRLRKTWYQS